MTRAQQITNRCTTSYCISRLLSSRFLGRKASAVTSEYRLGFFRNFFFGGGLVLDEFFELFHAGQFVQIFKSEMDEEFFGGLIKYGPPENFFASGGRHKLLVEKRLDNARGMDATDLLNFGDRDGLLVCDDGQGLQSSQ